MYALCLVPIVVANTQKKYCCCYETTSPMKGDDEYKRKKTVVNIVVIKLNDVFMYAFDITSSGIWSNWNKIDTIHHGVLNKQKILWDPYTAVEEEKKRPDVLQTTRIECEKHIDECSRHHAVIICGLKQFLCNAQRKLLV